MTKNMKQPIIIKLKRGLATIIRKRTGYSAAYISDILASKVRVDSWSTAKKLAAATGTMPYLWLEGTQEEIVIQVQTNLTENPTPIQSHPNKKGQLV